MQPVFQKCAGIFLLIMAQACVPSGHEPTRAFSPPDMSQEELFHKIFGSLLGTAIGDAMGAPTEMWSRDMIQAEYGHVSGLDDMVREPSAEGTWKWNLPAGGTTDDTRWKKLLIRVLASPEDADPARALAQVIVTEHDAALERLRAQESVQTAPYEDQLRQAQWLTEWARVARPWLAGDMDRYQDALHTFYGGEMVCAGMIYAPAVGMRYPGDPHKAYEVAYQMDLYDLGYARDMTGLMAGMVAAAGAPSATPDSILAVVREVDPKGYFQSRLVGRTAHKLLQTARYIHQQADRADVEAFFRNKPRIQLAIPDNEPTARQQYASWGTAYQLLDDQLRRMPFHPDEIWLIMLTGMLVCEFDFQATMEFIVNYGRDNDTVAAMTGAVLGMLHGDAQLPEQAKAAVTRSNLDLGMDLSQLAQALTEIVTVQ